MNEEIKQKILDYVKENYPKAKVVGSIMEWGLNTYDVQILTSDAKINLLLQIKDDGTIKFIKQS